MLLAQGRYWRASLAKEAPMVGLELSKSSLPEELQEAGDLRVEAPLARWNLLVKHVQGDRKLLGGVLLRVAVAVISEASPSEN